MNDSFWLYIRPRFPMPAIDATDSVLVLSSPERCVRGVCVHVFGCSRVCVYVCSRNGLCLRCVHGRADVNRQQLASSQQTHVLCVYAFGSRSSLLCLGSVNAVSTCLCKFAFEQQVCSRLLASECSRVCVYAVFTGFWAVFVFTCLRCPKIQLLLILSCIR